MEARAVDAVFHLAFPVDDLAAARAFYGGLLACPEGRASATWVDFDFFGHQLSLHLLDEQTEVAPTNPVDGDAVPSRHFGVVLSWEDWEELADHLVVAGIPFLIEPRVRFEGEPGEQGTFFLNDPSGNALEFKSFQDPARLFAREA